MKTLLLLRHAKSSWKDQTLCDHDRPLNKRGQNDAPRVGEWLSAQGLLPDVVFSSTALRAQSTARLMAETAGFTKAIELKRELYHADSGDFLETLKTFSDEICTALIVGHNPGMEEFLEMLTGQLESMPTCALAQIELPIDRWQDINRKSQGRVLRLWRPKAQN
jgi:phosphohistidine phosphatase